jgi:hypothetical protein
MQQFQITLKNEKARLYNQLSWLIIIIHIVIFIYLSLFSAGRNIRGISIAILILLAFCFFLKYYFRKTKWQIGFHPFFFLLISGWIGMSQYWLAAIPFIFDLMYTITTRKFNVTFSKETITYPSFPVKKIRWNEVSNIILKDGLLTIDFKNNKIIQQHIEETGNPVNEKEFNDFCSGQLIISNSAN